MAHVLVVDDELLVAEFLAMALADAGHRVTVAHDLEGALAADAAEPCDLLVTDVRMPGGGPALALALRARRPGLPVLVVSGLLLEAGQFLDTSEGPTLALSKPVRAPSLRDAAGYLLAAGDAAGRSPPGWPGSHPGAKSGRRLHPGDGHGDPG